MAKKQAPPAAPDDGEAEPGRYSNQSTMAVSKEIADRVREIAKANDSTALEVTNKLLEYALEHAKIKIEVRYMDIVPKDPRKK